MLTLYNYNVCPKNNSNFLNNKSTSFRLHTNDPFCIIIPTPLQNYTGAEESIRIELLFSLTFLLEAIAPPAVVAWNSSASKTMCCLLNTPSAPYTAAGTCRVCHRAP